MSRDDGSPAPHRVAALMQRVRIGLTGLAAVFLLVVLGASILGLASDEPSAENAGAVAQLNESMVPKEPLAELGVAPGGAPDTTNSTQPLPAINRR